MNIWNTVKSMTLSTVVIIPFSVSYACQTQTTNAFCCAQWDWKERMKQKICVSSVYFEHSNVSAARPPRIKSPTLNLSTEDHHSCILNHQKLPTSLSTVWHLCKVSRRQTDGQVLSAASICSSNNLNLTHEIHGWSCEKQMLSHGSDNTSIATAP